jgi:hypothetical protein
VNSASELIHLHWFFEIKKKTVHFNEQYYSGAWLHCSLNSGAMLHYWCFSQTRCCFSETCGAMWVLPTENIFILVTKRLLTWLRVNLTRSHVTKRARNRDYNLLNWLLKKKKIWILIQIKNSMNIKYYAKNLKLTRKI